MLKNYLLVALRGLWKNKTISLINIAGLAIGISASLVIYLIVRHEFSYETFQPDGDRIYRVVTNLHFPDMEIKNSGVPEPLPAAIRASVPGIESSTYFYVADETRVTVTGAGNDKKEFKKQKGIVYADSAYMPFVGYRWLAGSAPAALSGPNQVVLTESRAREYFNLPPAQVVGKTLTYNDSIAATVTGVVADLDEITDFTFREFVSYATYRRALAGEWGSVTSSSQFLVKLAKGTQPAAVNKALADLRQKHAKEDYLATDNILQPLRDIHFNADYDNFDQRMGHRPTLVGLLVVAAFLLLLGCINFINLSTAQGSRRAREIGIRKTMGGNRQHLIFQFLGETFLLTLAATIVSAALTPVLLKVFADFVPPDLKVDLLRYPELLLFGAAMIIFVSLVAGIYPALVLSRYKPVTVLKNVASAATSVSRRAWVRRVLTVSQFAIAQFFIIATLVVGKQIRYSLNRDMGFRKDAVINFTTPMDFDHPDGRQYVLLEKLRQVPGIRRLSLSGAPPATGGYNSTTMKFIREGKEIETTVETKEADTAYFDLYQMKLAAGRNLGQSDTLREYVINEAYARFLGYTDPAAIIGQTIQRGNRSIPIVGVVRDFNFKSTHGAITPLAFCCRAATQHSFHVLLNEASKNTDSWKATIARIGEAWKTVYPDQEFDYSFFDDRIAGFYRKEQQTGNLLNWSAGLAIFISCLGLLGLVIYTTTQRTREIGVRKVLGATVPQLVSILSLDLLKLVAIGFVIAVPMAGWIMHQWLQNFAFRTNLSWWVFALSGLAMVGVAFVTLSVQTIRAATANPVKALRSE